MLARWKGKTTSPWLPATQGSRAVSFILHLGNSANTATLSTVDTLTSGAGNDTIVFTGGLTNASIDLGGGSDTLTLGSAASTATVANTKTIVGGAGVRSI